MTNPFDRAQVDTVIAPPPTASAYPAKCGTESAQYLGVALEGETIGKVMLLPSPGKQILQLAHWIEWYLGEI